MEGGVGPDQGRRPAIDLRPHAYHLRSESRYPFRRLGRVSGGDGGSRTPSETRTESLRTDIAQSRCEKAIACGGSGAYAPVQAQHSGVEVTIGRTFSLCFSLSV
jgi:hypothetical protein